MLRVPLYSVGHTVAEVYIHAESTGFRSTASIVLVYDLMRVPNTYYLERVPHLEFFLIRVTVIEHLLNRGNMQ
jgi:hypothetical protein